MSEEIIPLEELEEELKRCPEWDIEGESIVRQWDFEGFSDAMEFVDMVADIAETACHHPEINIRYNKVKLLLATHEIGGVTEADLELAIRIDTLDDE